VGSIGAAAVTQQHSILAEADALLSALVLRADELEGCIEGSEEAELAVITDAIEAYEAKRWPLGKEPGGKVPWGTRTPAVARVTSIHRRLSAPRCLPTVARRACPRFPRGRAGY